MNEIIHQTIERVEQLYTALMGKPPVHPNGDGAPMSTDHEVVGQLHEQLDRMVAAMQTVVPGPTTHRPDWSPRAAMWTEDGTTVLALDTPDVLPEQVVIKVEPMVITVSGQRPPPWPRSARHVTGCDLPLGRFVRSFAFPVPVTREQVSARLESGVLAIRISTGARTEPSEISIT